MNTKLQTWLQEVTAPFPEDTARRLQEELASHHAEAVMALSHLGVQLPQDVALRELGDPGELRAELARTHYTLGELAWLGGDRRLAEAECKVLRLQQHPPMTGGQLVWEVAKQFGILLLLFGAAGTWTGLVPALGLSAPPSWFQMAPLALVLCMDPIARRAIQRFAPRSAAVLWRLWDHLHGALNFLAFSAIVAPLPGTVLLVGSVTVVWLVLRRPQEALGLLPKALRNAQ